MDGVERRPDAGQGGVAGLAVDERHAVEEETGGEPAQHQVLERGLLGALLGVGEAAEDVERDREQLDAEEDHQQARCGGEEHHPDGGAEDERVVLAVVEATAVEVAGADEHHHERAGEDDPVDEEAEAVVGVAAVVREPLVGGVEPAPDHRPEGHREEQPAQRRERGARRRRGDEVEQQEDHEAAAEDEHRQHPEQVVGRRQAGHPDRGDKRVGHGLLRDESDGGGTDARVMYCCAPLRVMSPIGLG